jgi:RNA polymerase sigma factor (sigma-70 family)
MDDSESEALRQAWETHSGPLWRAVLAWSASADVASDAVAEAFAQAARRGHAIEDVGAWTWRAAFRIAAGILAERRLAKLPVGAPSPAAATDRSMPDEVIALTDALAHLDPDDRQIIVLCLVGGWSSREVSQLLGVSPGAVRVRLHRARKKLVRLLEDHDA